MTPALLTLARAIAANPMLTFEGSPKQTVFVEIDHPRTMLRAPNRTGKTTSGAIKTWRFALENPGAVILVVCADHTSKVEVVGAEMDKWAPRRQLVDSDYNVTRGWRNNVIQLRNGSKIIFRSARSSTTSIAGLVCDAVWIDEPPPRALWGEILTRVATTNGPVWMTFTPIGQALEWLKLIVEGDQTRGIPPQQEWVQIVPELTVTDCPWRTQESIDSQVEAYGPWEYAQRAQGAWEGETYDRMIESFTESNIDSDVPRARWIAGLGMDHGKGAGREFVVLCLFSKAHSVLWAIAEYASEDATDAIQDGEAITQMLLEHNMAPHDIDRAMGDVNEAGKGTRGRVSVNRLLEEQLPGLTIETPDKSPGSVEYGSRLINLAAGRNHVRIHPRCRVLIRSLKHWQGKDDEHKHAVDAFRYIAVPMLEELYDPTTIDRVRLSRG